LRERGREEEREKNERGAVVERKNCEIKK